MERNLCKFNENIEIINKDFAKGKIIMTIFYRNYQYFYYFFK